MKILFSLTYYSPYISGLTIFVKRIAEELAKTGNDIQVICFRHERNFLVNETLNKVKVHRVNPWIKISKGFVSGEWITDSIDLIKSADVVIVVLPQAEGFLTALIAKLLKKRVVVVYLCQVETVNPIFGKLLNAVNWLSLRWADKIVTLTHDYAEHVKQLEKYKGDLKFIYPLIFRPQVDEGWKKGARRKIGKKELVIGVASRIAREKGLEYLFEAIPLIKQKYGDNFVIAIAGQADAVGEEAYKKQVLESAEMYKNKVVFLGNVPGDKMGSFYSLVDILILPSINSTEAFGMVQVEAMYWGVPVIATDLPGVRIPVQKTGMGIIVPIKNSHKIAEAIIEITNNKQKYVKSQKVLDEFDSNKILNQWKSLLLGGDNESIS